MVSILTSKFRPLSSPIRLEEKSRGFRVQILTKRGMFVDEEFLLLFHSIDHVE